MDSGRRRVLVVTGYAALAVALLHDATLSGGVLFRRDLSLVWYPMVEAFVRSVAAGSWPVWDPWRGFGQPLLADARAAVFYPTTWLNLVVQPWHYQTWFVCGHLVLAACGAYALLRRMGAATAAAFGAGALWLCSGPLVSLGWQFHHLAGAAWMPVVLACADRVLAEPGRRPVAVLALALALQVFAGSPDYTAVTALVMGVIAISRLVAPGSRAARLARFLAGCALGLLLSAVQWLPTLELARGSARWTSTALAPWTLHPLRLLELGLPMRWFELPLSPNLADALFEGREPYLASIYCGLLALVLAAAAGLDRRSVVPWVLAGSAALLSLGQRAPVYQLLMLIAPPLRVLRYPEKALLVTALAVAVLAGLGLDALASGRLEPVRRARWSALLLALLAAACAAALAFPSTRFFAGGGQEVPAFDGWGALSSDAPLARGTLLALRGALLCLATAAAFTLRLSPARQALIVACLAGLDLFWTHHRLNPTAPVDLFTSRPSPLALLGALDAARVYVYDYTIRLPSDHGEHPGAEVYALARVPQGWPRDAALVLGVLDYLNPPTAGRFGVRGSFDVDIVDLYPPPLRRLVAHQRELENDGGAHARLLRLGAVTHVLTLHEAAWTRVLGPPTTEPGLFREPIRIFAVPAPLPRVYAVGGARIASDAEAEGIIGSADFDPTQELVLPAGRARAAAAAFESRVDVKDWRPDRIALDVRLSEPGFVVLSDAFDPGWRTRVDGRRSEVLRANLAFRAVEMPAGEHALELRYVPPGLVPGGIASLAGLAVLLPLLRRRA